MGHNRSNHWEGHTYAPSPAIVVTPPGGEAPNPVEATKHISNALTASSVDPVQDHACSLELVQFAPETLARDVLPARRDGSVWKKSDNGLTPYWAARVKKTNLAKAPTLTPSIGSGEAFGGRTTSKLPLACTTPIP